MRADAAICIHLLQIIRFPREKRTFRRTLSAHMAAFTFQREFAEGHKLARHWCLSYISVERLSKSLQLFDVRREGKMAVQ